MKDQISQIISMSKESQPDIINRIGIALQYEYAPTGRHYRVPYESLGKQFWEAVEYDLQKIICDAESKEPRFLIDELLSGDIRDLATAILTILVSQLSIPLAIAIPIAALTIKLGLRRFCRLTLTRPNFSYSEILAVKRNEMRQTTSRGGRENWRKGRSSRK